MARKRPHFQEAVLFQVPLSNFDKVSEPCDEVEALLKQRPCERIENHVYATTASDVKYIRGERCVSAVEDVVIWDPITSPRYWAIWIAAWPTPPAAAWIRTDWPFCKSSLIECHFFRHGHSVPMLGADTVCERPTKESEYTTSHFVPMRSSQSAHFSDDSSTFDAHDLVLQLAHGHHNIPEVQSVGADLYLYKVIGKWSVFRDSRVVIIKCQGVQETRRANVQTNGALLMEILRG
ncbi:hypothetical protein HG530_012565 [Fusarium avenaceum]|nr:hypothetical protein HG530_012565 [Fusarium avenaceum]